MSAGLGARRAKMAVHTIMKLAAKEARKNINTSLDKIRTIQGAPENASREAIDKILEEIERELLNANEWVFAIESA